MSRVRITASRLAYALSLLCMAACTSTGLETPSTDAPVEQEPPDVEQPASPPEPTNEPAVEEDIAEQPPASRPASRVETNDSCRAIVRRNGEVVLAFADGEERLIDRNAMWQRSFGQAWALGEHAIVGVPQSEFPAGTASVAAFALVHTTRGVVWRGTAPAGDYLRATGFHSFTREGYVVVSDSRVIDPTGAEHSPIDGFLPVGASIDEDGFILVGRAGELAYWNTRADQLDVSVTSRLGLAITTPVQLGGLHGHDSAFVEENAAGELAFTRVSRSEVVRAPLTGELAARLREQLPAQNEEFETVATRMHETATLLVVDHRPAAWAGADATPHTFEAWSTLPIAHEIQIGGGCFIGTPVGATSIAEHIAGLWRVHTATGALEMGLRFGLPSGLSLVIPNPSEPLNPFPRLSCAGEGRMAVMLSGPAGFAWFSEGDAAFEQLTPWSSDRLDFYPPSEPIPAARRIMGPFEWSPTSVADDCELGYDDDGVPLLVDHARDLDLLLAPDANAALLDP